MKHVTYKHRDGGTATYEGPIPGLEASEAWQRVEGPAYDRMLKANLIELCQQRNLDTEGTVAQLAERLEAYDREHQ